MMKTLTKWLVRVVWIAVKPHDQFQVGSANENADESESFGSRSATA